MIAHQPVSMAGLHLEMILRYTALPILMALSLVACDDSVSLNYATRADAEAEGLFARGWLPEIIPPSSHHIVMRNDLDLNVSTGEFDFDPFEHDSFVALLERAPSRDDGESRAHAYEDWIFWINRDRNHCRFHMRLNRHHRSSEPVGHGDLPVQSESEPEDGNR
jgi:hypothetical protein